MKLLTINTGNIKCDTRVPEFIQQFYNHYEN